MIGFRNNRPLLKLGDFLIAEYGEQWLADALESAARQAGTTLPFKEDLLASVRYYLEHECDLSVMSLSDLYDRIRRMLRDVGLSHLARELKDMTPPITVSVAEIARSVPFWLFFDGELRQYLSRLREQGITRYRFTDKRNAFWPCRERSGGAVPASICWKIWTSCFPGMRKRIPVIDRRTGEKLFHGVSVPACV